jgi:hypothetical protein
VNIERVNHILRLNREGKKPASLDLDKVEEKIPTETLNSDLDRMDKKYKSKSRNKKKKKKGPGGPPGGTVGGTGGGGGTPRPPRNDNRPPRNDNRPSKPGNPR